MKKIFLIFALVLLSAFCFAQQDRIIDYSSMRLQDSIRVYDISSADKNLKKKWFVMVEGKVKKMPKDYLNSFNGTLDWKFIGITDVKKDKFIGFTSSDIPVKFYMSPETFDYLKPKMRSISYWKRYIQDNTSKYVFEYNQQGATADDRFRYVSWEKEPIMPQQMDGTVKFKYSCGGKEKILSDLSDTDNVFRNTREYYEDLRKELNGTSVDYHFFTASLVTNMENIAGSESKLKKDDLVFPFHYNSQNGTYKCYVQGDVKELKESYISFLDPDLKKILSKRSEDGIEIRDSLAYMADSLYTIHKLDSLRQLLIGAVYAESLKDKHLDEYLKEVKSKKLFLQDYEYSSDYSNCGLNFRIYNCFGKTIKYIQFTATPYNAVGDVQPDWMGKRSATAKGIGPLEPGYSASWDFDNMFYDHNDIISRIRPTGIKFIFMDGSTQNFSGYSNIISHRYYEYKELDIDTDDVIEICNRNIEPFVLPAISIPDNIRKLSIDEERQACVKVFNWKDLALNFTLAEYPGGEDACYSFLSRNVKYPKDAQDAGIQGRVLVRFFVNADGSIDDVEAVRSPHESLSKEAVRVVKLMPKWKPGTEDGKPARTRFNLPIMFRLGE